MTVESMFRIAFWLLLCGMILMQVWFANQFRQAGEPVTADSKAVVGEGRTCAVFRIMRSLALITCLVLYGFNPSWMSVLTLDLPAFIRWAGILLGVFSLIFYAWSRAVLGEAWSSHLETRKNQALVTTGPYTRVRHPIYLAMLGFLVSLAIVTANLLFFALLAFSVIDLALRIPKEEQIMIEAFGEDYKAYMQRTGRLFPKII